MRGNAEPVRTTEELQQVLEELQDFETFDPPPELRAQANIQARQPHRDHPFTTTLADGDPPFYQPRTHSEPRAAGRGQGLNAATR
jgi:hypothetical protein